MSTFLTKAIFSLKTRKEKFSLFALLVVAEATYFFFQVQWDPDSYHDGFVFASAVAVSEGKLPNRDAFALYGPVMPELQGIWLRFTSVQLIQLRILSSILIFITSILIYILIRDKLNIKLAFLCSLTWVIGNPLITTATMPWPDVLTTLITLVIILLHRMKRSTSLRSTAIALLIIIGSLTRINFLPVLVVVSLYFTIKIFQKEEIDQARVFFYSLFSIITLLVYFLHIKGLLFPYYKQCIEYAFQMHSQERTLRGLLNFRVLIFGLIIVVLSQLYLKLELLRARFKIFLLPTLTVFSIVIFTFSGINRKPEIPYTSAGKNLIENIYLFIRNVPYTYLYFTVFIALLNIVYLLMTKSKLNLEYVLTIATLTQLYPSPNINRIWFIAPILISSNPRYLSTVLPINFHKRQEHILRFLYLPTLVSLICIFVMQLQSTRVPFESKVLVGMKGSPKNVRVLDENISKLNSYPLKNNVRFECTRGLFSVSDGKYNAKDENYVNLIPPFNHNKVKSDYVFYCDLESQKLSKLLANGYKLEFQTESNLDGMSNALFKLN